MPNPADAVAATDDRPLGRLIVPVTAGSTSYPVGRRPSLREPSVREPSLRESSVRETRFPRDSYARRASRVPSGVHRVGEHRAAPGTCVAGSSLFAQDSRDDVTAVFFVPTAMLRGRRVARRAQIYTPRLTTQLRSEASVANRIARESDSVCISFK